MLDFTFASVFAQVVIPHVESKTTLETYICWRRLGSDSRKRTSRDANVGTGTLAAKSRGGMR
jgi:hypothetical protein